MCMTSSSRLLIIAYLIFHCFLFLSMSHPCSFHILLNTSYRSTSMNINSEKYQIIQKLQALKKCQETFTSYASCASFFLHNNVQHTIVFSLPIFECHLKHSRIPSYNHLFPQCFKKYSISMYQFLSRTLISN